MFLKNDPSSEKRYYNGMIGEVVTVNEEECITLPVDFSKFNGHIYRFFQRMARLLCRKPPLILPKRITVTVKKNGT